MIFKLIGMVAVAIALAVGILWLLNNVHVGRNKRK